MSSGPLSHPQQVKQGHVPFLNVNRMRTFSPRSEGESRPPSFPALSVPLLSFEGLNTLLSLAHSWCLPGPSQEHSTGVFLSSSSAVCISLLFLYTRKILFLGFMFCQGGLALAPRPPSPQHRISRELCGPKAPQIELRHDLHLAGCPCDESLLVAWPDDHKAAPRPATGSQQSGAGSSAGRRESGWERGKEDAESSPGRKERGRQQLRKSPGCETEREEETRRKDTRRTL